MHGDVLHAFGVDELAGERVALGDMASRHAGLSRKLTSTASKASPACSSAIRARMAYGQRRKV
jgi:hypothetical protein